MEEDRKVVGNHRSREGMQSAVRGKEARLIKGSDTRAGGTKDGEPAEGGSRIVVLEERLGEHHEDARDHKNVFGKQCEDVRRQRHLALYSSLCRRRRAGSFGFHAQNRISSRIHRGCCKGSCDRIQRLHEEGRGFMSSLLPIIVLGAYSFSVGIKQNFIAIEAGSGSGSIGAVGTIGVDLASPDAWNLHVPIMPGEIRFRGKLDHVACGLCIFTFEEQEVHCTRARGEDAEVDAVGGDGGSQRKGASGFHKAISSFNTALHWRKENALSAIDAKAHSSRLLTILEACVAQKDPRLSSRPGLRCAADKVTTFGFCQIECSVGGFQQFVPGAGNTGSRCSYATGDRCVDTMKCLSCLAHEAQGN